jgi:hypothetical protein
MVTFWRLHPEKIMPSRRNGFAIVRLNLILSIVEGLVVMRSLLSVSSEGESIFFLSYSLPRLMLLGVVLALISAFVWLLAQSIKNSISSSIIENLIGKVTTFWFFLILGMAVYFLIFAADRLLGDFVSYRERLSPVLIWVGLICLQSLVVFMYLRAVESAWFGANRGILRPAGIALLLLAALIAFISLTRVGLTPDPIYWQGPGVPLLMVQLIPALAGGLVFKFIVDQFGNSKQSWVNQIVCIGLWALAVMLWWIQPARISYNELEPGLPNFQRYPFGDAILYDTVAHDMLNGTALPNDFWVKPLYSAFLAFLHLFAGEEYGLLILLQISILALIPVLVYLLVSLVGNRSAGIIAGLLVILRERNAIALANVIQVSHLKLLLSDVFSMGLVVLLLWLLFRWLEKPAERRAIPLVIGGALGQLILTRGHPVLLIPLILVVFFFIRTPGYREQWQRAGLVVAGVALILIPWLWRIYETMDRFALQSPVSPYSANLVGLYNLTPYLADPEAFTTEVSSRTLEYSDLQNRQIMDFILQHPDEVIRFVSAHYFHNVIYSYIYLPQSFRIESLRAYVTTEPFWGAWQGEFSVQNWILLFMNMTLIALGIGVAWRKHGIPSLVPLLIGMGYNASVSVGRISGWRFIQPVDWITLIYYSLGIVQLFYLVGFLLTRREQKEASAEEQLSTRRMTPQYVQVMGYAIIFFLIGAAVPYGNRLFAGRYPEKTAGQLTDEYITAASSFSQPYSEADLARFLEGDRAQILYGQAIYPYYLEADSGPINHAWPAYKPRPYNRLVIFLSGPVSTNVILPLATPDFTFPDGTDVIVLGCTNDFGDIEALAILKQGDTSAPALREPFPELICPFPEPK